LHDDILDAEDVLGKRLVSTRLQHNVTIREENATAALEVMSRFAANPNWLIYLPPTMSPCETSNEPGLLEHPAEAFSYFRSQGVPKVVCEEKHMGSRAVVVVCRDADAARERFGVTEGEAGIVYTRTGRRFFNDAEVESQLLERLRAAMTASRFWEDFETSWACLDCELMPWSAKAQELLRSQYAAVGASGRASLPEVIRALEQAAGRMSGDAQSTTAAVLERLRGREQSVGRFVDAYRQYCWSVASLDDLKLAPFHLLATDGKVHTNQNHVWHMETLAKVCQEDVGILLATAFNVVDLTDVDSIAGGIAWWTGLTARGGEGMVVKPLDWIARGKKGLVQPAVKCRGKEYLRIIYGPDYDSDENLPRLRSRSLGRKRSLALREFALGLEALERFVRRVPLRRVHECVFGVLALESEPVDPRL
jgi:polynucleotide kinase-phosphatase